MIEAEVVGVGVGVWCYSGAVFCRVSVVSDKINCSHGSQLTATTSNRDYHTVFWTRRETDLEVRSRKSFLYYFTHSHENIATVQATIS